MKPRDVSDLDMAFPASVSHLMPKFSEIPEVDPKWKRFMSDWFYSGIKGLCVTPKDGIDPQKALRHLKCIISSFEPKHEHKEAAVAYLASLWFDDVKYEKTKK